MPTADFENRLKNQKENIEENPDISEGNKELLLNFDRDLSVQDYTEARRHKLLTTLKITAEHVDFQFNEATEDDLKNTVAWINSRDVGDETKRDYKVILKRFYKWLNDEDEHPDEAKFINTNPVNGNSGTLPKDVLTEEDIQDLVDAATNPRDRAFASLLWETGARIGELIDLTIRDIEDHDKGLKVVVDGKTGQRRILLISSVPHIRNWLNMHPRTEDRDAALWVNLGNAHHGEKVGYRALNKRLKELADEAEVDKPVNPHHFRHSRATYLANKFTEAQLCEWFGWTQGSRMAAKYVHLSGRDIDASYRRLHGIEEEEDEPEESQLAPEPCPRCNKDNPPKASFCYNCGQAFDLEAAEKLEENEEKLAREADQEKLDRALDVLGVEDEARREALKTLMEGVGS